jgi:dsRNA-specific ribonuclease
MGEEQAKRRCEVLNAQVKHPTLNYRPIITTGEKSTYFAVGVFLGEQEVGIGF